jgi:NADH-quinone oxidoreductase subunit L
MSLYVLIPFLPLFASIAVALFGPRLKEKSHRIAAASVLFSFVLSVFALVEVIRQGPIQFSLYSWMHSFGMNVQVGFYIDSLTVVMLLLITGVSSMVHLYSIHYMQGDAGYARFFAFLSLFTSAILMMVMADNLLFLYLVWEIVGLCLYLLLSHQSRRKKACAAAAKTFLINRIGGMIFLLGVILVYVTFGTFNYQEIFLQAKTHFGETLSLFGWKVQANTMIALLIFGGAAARSAQIPFHVWLPDTMGAPTPVSALMHAGMINAGGFMIARLSPLFALSSAAMNFIAFIGAITAFYGTTVMLTQTDRKRMLGYSTIGQMGFMIMEVGVGAYATAIFHLAAHGLFKATLFLSAGDAVHLKSEQRVPKYGILSVIGVALAVTIPFVLLFGLDELLRVPNAEGHGGTTLWFFAWATAFLTAFYLFQLIYSAGIHAHAPHETGPLLSRSISPIIITLMLLFLGYFALPFFGLNWFEHFLTPVMGGSGATHQATLEWSFWVAAILSVVVVFSGWLIAYFYIGGSGWIASDRLTEKLNLLYVFFLNKGYADDVYQALIVAPVLNFAYRLRKRDGDGPIDRLAKRIGDRFYRSFQEKGFRPLPR